MKKSRKQKKLEQRTQRAREKKPADLSPRCHAPWQTMMIDAAGVVSPCAYRNNYNNLSSCGPCGNVNENTLEEIWNGEEYRKLRQHMATGNLEAAGCANCLALKQKQPLKLQYASESQREKSKSSAYARNMELKRREIARGATTLKSKPTVVYYTPTHKCNLRCTHCYQDVSRTLSLSRKDTDQEVLDLFPVLDQIIAGGGEPLLLPIWRKFIDQADLNVNPYLQFATTTNATVIPDTMLDGLKRFKRLALTVSVDGVTKEVFEKIRLRGNFEKVVQNVDRLVALTEAHPNAAMSVTFSVMKDNILQLPDLMRFCAEHRTTYNLLPVLCYPADLSLRAFNNPFVEMAGWREAIENGQQMLEKWLIGPGRVNPDLREVYRAHFSALEENIPFEILEQHHFRIEGTVPRGYLAHYEEHFAGPLDQHLQVGFFPMTNGKTRDCRYYANVEDQDRFRVSLPAGDYVGALFPRNKPAVAFAFWHLQVNEKGQLKSTWRGPSVLRRHVEHSLRSIRANLSPTQVRGQALRLGRYVGFRRHLARISRLTGSGRRAA